MDFANIPRVFIKYNGQVVPITTLEQSEAQFIFSLRLHFGQECVPPKKTVVVVGERETPQGKEVLKIPLNLLLKHGINHSEPLTFEVVDPVPEESVSLQPQGGPNAVVKSASGPKSDGAVSQDRFQDGGVPRSAADARRASQLKKGHIVSKKKDENGNVITTLGQNDDELLTKLERKEVQKYVLLHWELDEASGRPYNQSDQDDSSRVELSFLEMQKSPVLRGRPVGALRRYAQRWVWNKNKRGKILKRGLDILELRENGYELPGGSAKRKESPAEKSGKRKPLGEKSENSEAAEPKKASYRGDSKSRQESGDKTTKTKSAASVPTNSNPNPKPGGKKADHRPNSKKRSKQSEAEIEPDERKNQNDASGGDDKDCEDKDARLPVRKRKKSAKVADNDARAAEKNELAQKPPRITKKAKEESRKRLAREVQEASVAETLAGLKGTMAEDEVTAWYDRAIDKMEDVFTFSELLDSAPRRFSENDILSILDREALLVQGCWVKKRRFSEAGPELQASIKEVAALGHLREYFLGRFTEWRWLTEDTIDNIRVPQWLIEEAMKGIAEYDDAEEPAWEFARPTDLDFLERYEEIASQHAARWVRSREASRILVGSLNTEVDSEEGPRDSKSLTGKSAAKAAAKQIANKRKAVTGSVPDNQAQAEGSAGEEIPKKKGRGKGRR